MAVFRQPQVPKLKTTKRRKRLYFLTLRQSGRTGSNRRQRRWQRRALPTELRPQQSVRGIILRSPRFTR